VGVQLSGSFCLRNGLVLTQWLNLTCFLEFAKHQIVTSCVVIVLVRIKTSDSVLFLIRLIGYALRHLLLLWGG